MKLEEINDTWYAITQGDGKMTETDDKDAARLAILEGWEVSKNSHRIFSSGDSEIRLYVTTEIFTVKDL